MHSLIIMKQLLKSSAFRNCVRGKGLFSSNDQICMKQIDTITCVLGTKELLHESKDRQVFFHMFCIAVSYIS